MKDMKQLLENYINDEMTPFQKEIEIINGVNAANKEENKTTHGLPNKRPKQHGINASIIIGIRVMPMISLGDSIGFLYLQ